MNLRLFIIFFLLIASLSCIDQKEKESKVTVFCAASLSPVLEQIKQKWEKEYGEKIIINTASSGTLARQIENGAKADIYLSANEDWMKYLIDCGLRFFQEGKRIIRF